MKRVAVLAHSRPSNTDGAIIAAAKAAAEAGCELVVVEREPDPAGRREAIDDIRFVATLPDDVDLCLALGGDGTILRALRRYTGTTVPVFGINYGTVGFLAAAEPDDLEAGLARAMAGDFETVSLPGLDRRRDADRRQRRLVHPAAPSPRRRPQLQRRRQRGRAGPLRRPRRRDPGRLDRVQPRQQRADPRLGRRGLRRQLHRAAHPDRTGAGRRPRRRPSRRQRRQPRPR